MAGALLDLENVLRSKKEQMSLQEANVLLASRAKAMRDFTVGLGGGSLVTWLATRRLGTLFRLNLTAVAAAVCGLWRLDKSTESSVEHILSLEGSQIQGELANILLKRYYNNPWVQQCLSKHFYSEEVYDDSSVDKPVLRWRFRNYYGYPLGHSQSASYSEGASYSEKINSENPDVQATTSTARTSTELKQVIVNGANDDDENIFNTIFGLPGSSETNVPDPSIPNLSSRRKARREKRNCRRRSRSHQEESEI